jgi:hypothetical protein
MLQRKSNGLSVNSDYTNVVKAEHASKKMSTVLTVRSNERYATKLGKIFQHTHKIDFHKVHQNNSGYEKYIKYMW